MCTHVQNIIYNFIIYKHVPPLAIHPSLHKTQLSASLQGNICWDGTWRWNSSLVVMVTETRRGSSDFSAARGKSSRHSSEELTDSSLYAMFLWVTLTNVCSLRVKENKRKKKGSLLCLNIFAAKTFWILKKNRQRI